MLQNGSKVLVCALPTAQSSSSAVSVAYGLLALTSGCRVVCMSAVFSFCGAFWWHAVGCGTVGILALLGCMIPKIS